MAGDAVFSDLPAHWEVTTLGEVCLRGGGDIQTGPFGSQLHASDYVPAGIPSIMPVNIGDNRIIEDGIARVSPEDVERLGRHKLRVGDIVYSRRGDVERRALVRAEQEGWLCGTGCVRVRLGAGCVDPMYASYYLGHPDIRAWIVRHAVGATMPNLNTEIMSALPFVVPPLKEQEAIAHILGTLDDKIELNRRMNETLETMARAVFKSWFVDFDPVRAKAEGRDPGLPKPLADLFPDSFEDSERGEIPVGWEVATLADDADLNPESWATSTAPRQIEYVDLANTKWGKIEATQAFNWSDAPSRAQRILRPGDTIVGTVRPGNGSFAFISEEGLTGSTGFAVLRARKATYREWVYFVATARENIERLAHIADGAAYPAVRPDAVLATATIRPPETVVNCCSKLVRAMMARAAANSRESRTLAALRDTLLPKLLSGDVRVKDAEGIFDEVI